ncbi:MAG TPA: HDOD domain-containing protein, partial [Opitutales bacterium]|nr:HDOD domain-containing protein [Opitutales bacterium]
DLGLLVLNTATPDSYEQVRQCASGHNLSLHDAEKAVLGATHAELGAYMMGLWGFQDDIVEAVACHHNPSEATESKSIGPLLFTHIADALVPPCRDNPEPARIDTAYVESLGMGEHLSEWQNTAESLISDNQ